MEKNFSRVKLLVKGLVQGVGFRYFCYKNAISLDLKGYAKNLSNGDVEIIAEGKKENLKSFMEYIKKGPSISRVDKVTEVWENYFNEFKDFCIW